MSIQRKGGVARTGGFILSFTHGACADHDYPQIDHFFFWCPRHLVSARRPLMTRSFLEIARAHFERQLETREAQGDETVPVHRYRMPWGTDGLGPGLSDPDSLRRLEDDAVTAGKLQHFLNGHIPIRWIDRRADLVARFLQELTDAYGGDWPAFRQALWACWDRPKSPSP